MTRYKILIEVRPFGSNDFRAWRTYSKYVSAFDADHAEDVANIYAETRGLSVRNVRVLEMR